MLWTKQWPLIANITEDANRNLRMHQSMSTCSTYPTPLHPLLKKKFQENSTFSIKDPSFKNKQDHCMINFTRDVDNKKLLLSFSFWYGFHHRALECESFHLPIKDSKFRKRVRSINKLEPPSDSIETNNEISTSMWEKTEHAGDQAETLNPKFSTLPLIGSNPEEAYQIWRRNFAAAFTFSKAKNQREK